MNRWRLPSTFLPDGDERDLWVVDGSFSTTPVTGSEQLPGRFALPGLVDAHAHVALVGHEPVGATEALAALQGIARAGVLLVRDVGAPRSVTLEISLDPTSPEFLPAGRWLAPAGRFFESFHEPVPVDGLRAAALAEVARGARWIKVVADWDTAELSYDEAALQDLIAAVHRAGARVTAHVQWTGVGRVVAAGVDSIEHGCLLDDATLEVMAEKGVAWTPTLTAFNQPLPDDVPPERRARIAQVLDNYRTQIPRAVATGVTILAGTDTAGTVVDEIRQLIAYGLTPVQALRAATTDARTFLGASSFESGGPADVVTYAVDPRNRPRGPCPSAGGPAPWRTDRLRGLVEDLREMTTRPMFPERMDGMTNIDWLLDSDPAIRWQVMRDLMREPADVVAAERSRIATEGWGARLLALQAPDGRWGGKAVVARLDGHVPRRSSSCGGSASIPRASRLSRRSTSSASTSPGAIPLSLTPWARQPVLRG